MSSPIVGLIMGVIFGASLVLTGLTNPDKIIGALRLKDFYVSTKQEISRPTWHTKDPLSYRQVR